MLMINISRKQDGSAHIAIVIILVVALLGALGFIFWQNVVVDKNVTESSQQTSNSTSQIASGDSKGASDREVAEQTGTIVGSLIYPSEGIPSSMEVHAVNLDTGKEYTTKDHIKGSQYQYGTGYSIKVPAGRYNVYGTVSEMPGVKAYYNQVIVCGVKVECKDTKKIEVIVEADKNTGDATVGDWWSTE